MAPSKRGTASQGITRLYILQSTKGIHQLAGRMQTLTKVLDGLKSAPPEEWRVEVAYKIVRGPRTGTGREAEQQQEAGVTGESLYVVKSSEAPGKVFMLAAKAKTSSSTSKGGGEGGGGGGGAAAAAAKEFSPLVEMGGLGDEMVGILKGYSNRLVLQIEGTSYRVSGGLLQAAAGFLNRGNALSSIVLQVRYENEYSSLADAQQVLGEFVGMCLTGQDEEEEEEGREDGMEEGEGGEGGREDEEEEEAEVAAVTPGPAAAAVKKEGKAKVKVERPSGGGREGGREGGRVPALKVKSVDPSLVRVPGFVKEDIYTMKFAALQYIELFKVA